VVGFESFMNSEMQTDKHRLYEKATSLKVFKRKKKELKPVIEQDCPRCNLLYLPTCHSQNHFATFLNAAWSQSALIRSAAFSATAYTELTIFPLT